MTVFENDRCENHSLIPTEHSKKMWFWTGCNFNSKVLNSGYQCEKAWSIRKGFTKTSSKWTSMMLAFQTSIFFSSLYDFINESLEFVKGYLPYKMIASRNVSSEAGVKNFFTS